MTFGGPLPKHIASRTLKAGQLSWNNSQLIRGDVVKAVAELKQRPGKELQIHGSGELARALMAHNLIGVYRLWVFPVVLGEVKFGSVEPAAG